MAHLYVFGLNGGPVLIDRTHYEVISLSQNAKSGSGKTLNEACEYRPLISLNI